MKGSSAAFGMNAEAIDILQTMIRIEHPDAIPNLIKDDQENRLSTNSDTTASGLGH